VYWKPVFNVLEAALNVILVNARDAKAVPGRKTDVRDCEWLADLLRHGLLRASFIPPLEIRDQPIFIAVTQHGRRPITITHA
jgi:transposase